MIVGEVKSYHITPIATHHLVLPYNLQLNCALTPISKEDKRKCLFSLGNLCLQTFSFRNNFNKIRTLVGNHQARYCSICFIHFMFSVIIEVKMTRQNGTLNQHMCFIVRWVVKSWSPIFKVISLLTLFNKSYFWTCVKV